MLLRNKVLTTFIFILFFIPFGSSYVVQADDDFNVRDVHLSWQNDVSSTMTVSWRTVDTTSSVVQYGLSDSYGQEETGTEVGIWHHVELTGLLPNTIYHYRAGNGDLWSKDYTFKTGTLSNHTQFICLGDAQADNTKRVEIVSTIDRIPVDMMMYTGDYVETSTSLEEYIAWFVDYRRVVTDTATMGILGNHEHNYSIFYEAWSFPGKEEYYSFDFGPVHVIGLHTLDTNYITDPAVYTAQADWLVADLEANQDALWTIVMMHTPAFSSYHRYHDGQYVIINETFVPIFEEYNVSLVLTGHDHGYERLLCNDVNYIVAGGAGSTLYNPEEIIEYSVYQEKTYNFQYLEINENKLHVRAFRPDYSFIDQLILNKDIKPDLSFETIPLTYTQDWEDNLAQSIVITNTGDVNVTTNTTLAYTTNGTTQFLEIPPLDVGEKYTLNYDWSLANPGEETFLFELDYDSEYDEVSEDNNILEIKLIGTETVEPTTTPTDDTAFLAGILGSLIMILSLVLPVFIKKKGKFS